MTFQKPYKAVKNPPKNIMSTVDTSETSSSLSRLSIQMIPVTKNMILIVRYRMSILILTSEFLAYVSAHLTLTGGECRY